MDEALSELEIRREIAEILDNLSTLPAHAIAERFRLRERKDDLIDQLKRFAPENSSEIAQRWNKRAGSKSSEDQGSLLFPSDGEGGGAG